MPLKGSSVQKPLYHEPNVQSSRLSLKVVADTFGQINTMRADEFQQKIHMFIHCIMHRDYVIMMHVG